MGLGPSLQGALAVWGPLEKVRTPIQKYLPPPLSLPPPRPTHAGAAVGATAGAVPAWSGGSQAIS